MTHLGSSGFTTRALVAAVATATVALGTNDALAQRADDSSDAALAVYPDPGRVTGNTSTPTAARRSSGSTG